MAVIVQCSSCGEKFRARDEFLGKHVKCPACRSPMTVDGERVPNHEVFLSYSNKDKAVALRDRAAEQIATGINAAKDAIPEFGAGYRKILGDHMDEDVDAFYDKVRAKLSGVLPGGKSDQGKG